MNQDNVCRECGSHSNEPLSWRDLCDDCEDAATCLDQMRG